MAVGQVTPYAVLLVRSSDGDDAVRRAYHAIARLTHPDVRRGLPSQAQARATERWHAATMAYSLVKTQALREAWARSVAGLAGVCITCDGLGVTWRRLGNDRAVKICARCDGAGRTR